MYKNKKIVEQKEPSRDLVLSIEKLKQTNQAISKLWADAPKIANEIMKLFEADLKSIDLPEEVIKNFMDGFCYDDATKKRHYGDAFILRSNGIPVVTDQKKKTYMIAKDQDQINKATENEVNKTAKKVARMYYFSQITPKGVLKKLKQED